MKNTWVLAFDLFKVDAERVKAVINVVFISISFCISTVEVLAGDTELLLPALAPTRLRSKLGIFGAGFVVLVLVLESSVPQRLGKSGSESGSAFGLAG